MLHIYLFSVNKVVILLIEWNLEMKNVKSHYGVSDVLSSQLLSYDLYCWTDYKVSCLS